MLFKVQIKIYIWFGVFLLMGPWMALPCEANSIVNSKHNLSVSGYGTVKATTEEEICIFCHAPHNASAQAPLWNRYNSGQTYIPYTSSTAKAVTGQPTGASKLCLSCHDGTVAIGMVRSRLETIVFEGGITVMPDTRKRIGTDLSDDHPISFPFNSILASGNPELVDPSTLTGSVKLDRNGEMQCTSCHDPHDDLNGKFLVVNLIQEGLCVKCHNRIGWSTALHNISGFSSPNRCLNCHTPHAAGGKQRILVYAAEENNCYLGCHSVSSTKTNIQGEFNKAYKHPITSTTGVHDPTEPVLMDPAKRHVECQDCHNPHRANDQDTLNLKGSLSGVRGINASGAAVAAITYEYELCFRCHGDSNGGVARINRQYPETNTRLEFATSNPSYHPVEGVGKNPDVPSLISPLTTSSIIKCTDCHNTNNTNSYPNGPHGSNYSPLLARLQTTTDNTSESSTVYALCYKCHNRNSILSNQSFKEHNKHISEKRAPCTTCHDPHASKNVPHLINFDRNIVSPNSNGILRFDDLGRFSGRCYLRCHGEDHGPKTY